MQATRRLFIADHLCAQPYGHNLNALILFKKSMSPFFDEITCLATKDLPSYAEQSAFVERILHYPYAGLVAPPPRTDRSISPAKGKSKTFSLSKHLSFYTNNFLERSIGYNNQLRRTITNWKDVFKRYEIRKEDTIFFPSADHYGVISLLSFLQTQNDDLRPSVGIRMIGVAEGMTYGRQLGKAKFFESVRKAEVAGVTVSLSAETITLVDYVKKILGREVTFLPYPLSLPLEPVNWRDVKNLSSPGQGRADKGFFRLFPILRGLAKRGQLNHFALEVQDMRPSDKYFRARYSDMLRQVDGLVLHPARLRQAEIDDMYRRADIILMPYDPGTYALRGSAIYQEAISVGRLFVCSAGLGMSDLIARYENGVLADRDHDFSDRILQLAAMNKGEVEAKVTRARALYKKDFDDGLAAVVSRLTQ
jgi:hypothetical protein